MSEPTPQETTLLARLGFNASMDKAGLYKKIYIETVQGRTTRYGCFVDYRRGPAPEVYGGVHGGALDPRLAETLAPLVEFKAERLRLLQAAQPGGKDTVGKDPIPSPQGGVGTGGASHPPLTPKPGPAAPEKTAGGQPARPGPPAPAPAQEKPPAGPGTRTSEPAPGAPTSPEPELLHYVNVNIAGRWVRGAYTEEQRRAIEKATIKRNLELLYMVTTAYLKDRFLESIENLTQDMMPEVLAIFEGVRRHAHHEAEARAIHGVIQEEARAAEERRRKAEAEVKAAAEARRREPSLAP